MPIVILTLLVFSGLPSSAKFIGNDVTCTDTPVDGLPGQCIRTCKYTLYILWIPISTGYSYEFTIC